MVGQILDLPSADFLELRRLFSSGELGRLKYIYSSRITWASADEEKYIVSLLPRTSRHRSCGSKNSRSRQRPRRTSLIQETVDTT